MLTGKCKIDFEKWLENHIIFCTVDDLLYWFYEQPSMMQYGVYLEFFDSVGIIIDIQPSMDYDNFTYIGVDSFMVNVIKLMDAVLYDEEVVEFKTRQEAREQAILKANKIYNSN